MEKKRILIIGNPVAGGGSLKKIDRAEASLKARGLDVHLRLTARKGDAERFAREVSSEPDVIVIAAGGDGTYNEVANGLANSNTPMAILPLGTTSVLAKELNFPPDMEKVLEIALQGRTRVIHLGRITLTKNRRQEAGDRMQEKGQRRDVNTELSRYFLLMAGIGFDGAAVYGVNEKIKRYSGKGAYILSGLKTLLNFRPKPFLIKANGSSYSGYTAIAGKASCYGGSYRITPDARLDDPAFYVFVTHKKGRLRFLRYVYGILRGKNLKSKDVSYFRTSAMYIKGDAHIQIDGDYFGKTPAKIEIVKDALRLIC